MADLNSVLNKYMQELREGSEEDIDAAYQQGVQDGAEAASPSIRDQAVEAGARGLNVLRDAGRYVRDTATDAYDATRQFGNDIVDRADDLEDPYRTYKTAAAIGIPAALAAGGGALYLRKKLSQNKG